MCWILKSNVMNIWNKLKSEYIKMFQNIRKGFNDNHALLKDLYSLKSHQRQAQTKTIGFRKILI